MWDTSRPPPIDATMTPPIIGEIINPAAVGLAPCTNWKYSGRKTAAANIPIAANPITRMLNTNTGLWNSRGGNSGSAACLSFSTSKPPHTAAVQPRPRIMGDDHA